MQQAICPAQPQPIPRPATATPAPAFASAVPDMEATAPKLCADCGQDVGKGGPRRGRCNRCYIRFRKAAKAAGVFVPINPPAPLRERLLDKAVAGPGGCLIWTAQVEHKGYGRFNADGRPRPAHRVAYELFVGPIPDGLVIDHICHNRDAKCPGGLCLHRRCINPHHLEPVTIAENLLRSANSGVRKTRCVNGHTFDEATTYVDPKGHRVCRECSRSRSRMSRARVRAQAPTTPAPAPAGAQHDPCPNCQLPHKPGNPCRPAAGNGGSDGSGGSDGNSDAGNGRNSDAPAEDADDGQDRAAQLLDLLTAIRDALDIPHAATTGHDETRTEILTRRIRHTVVALGNVLDGAPLGIPWETAYLRKRLAEHPAAGYVTTAQARAALTAGKTRAEGGRVTASAAARYGRNGTAS